MLIHLILIGFALSQADLFRKYYAYDELLSEELYGYLFFIYILSFSFQINVSMSYEFVFKSCVIETIISAISTNITARDRKLTSFCFCLLVYNIYSVFHKYVCTFRHHHHHHQHAATKSPIDAYEMTGIGGKPMPHMFKTHGQNRTPPSKRMTRA